MIPQFCIAHPLILRIVVSVIIAHTNKMAAFFYAAWLALKMNRCFLVNKHGDLYLLLHNFGALTILFMLKTFKKICSDKKILLKSCTKSLVNHANCDLENKDSRKVLSHGHLKMFDCAMNYI